MPRYGYARVSTEDQSTELQREQLLAAGCTVVRAENASGSNRDGRPELRLILEFIRDGDTLVVTKLDRLARNTLDMLGIITELGDKGASFISLAEPWANTDSPAAKLMLTLMAGIATFERERIRERQAEGIAAAKARGVYKGRKPTAQAKTSDVLRLEAEGLGATEIARQLNISRASVYRILGEFGVQDQTIGGAHGSQVGDNPRVQEALSKCETKIMALSSPIRKSIGNHVDEKLPHWKRRKIVY